MEIAVIGGCGFIGESVTSKLVQNNHRVLSVHTRTHEPHRKDVECFFGNFGDEEFMGKVLSRSDCLIHLGARYTPAEAALSPGEANFNDLNASKKLIEIAISLEIPRIIFASSGGAIYGNLTDRTFAEENMVPRPTSLYGQIKLELEKTLLQKARVSSTKIQSLRISNAYGPGQNARRNFGVIPTFLNRVEEQKPLTILNPSSSRDYIFVEDVAEAFLKSLKYEGPVNVFNIGTGVATTPIELVELICELRGKSPPSLMYSEGLPNSVSFNALDISLAIKELTWQPKYSLAEGLAKLIASKDQK